LKNLIKIFLGLLTGVILFHFCIIIKVIPYTIAWGGRLSSDQEMYVFEILSILINVFLAFILLMKGGFIKHKFSEKLIHIILWIFFVLFILNTIGNSVAKTTFEKFFAIITGLFAILIWGIVKKKKN
jgi:hypothetical protein